MTTIDVEGRSLKLSNLDKVLYPASGSTFAPAIALRQTLPALG